ncbi:MAG: hypothetical protein QG656_2263 [Candidatus Hydrogenedentes bacterium]|nr:hypothetical protein [Candidatus Hydrogenedentota bacterium]
MAIKYTCAKCGKRFVDWGAEKLGFRCPDCEDSELVRVGGGADRPARKPSLRRHMKAAVKPVRRDEEDEFETLGVMADDEAVVDEELIVDDSAVVDDDALVPDAAGGGLEAADGLVFDEGEVETPEPEQEF